MTIIDLAEVLSESDKQRLVHDTAGISLPPEVQAVRYLTFAENHPNINDAVEYFVLTYNPEWIQDGAFAPGELIIAVGMDPRMNGAYCGNDVCAAVDFYGEGRGEEILGAMVGSFQEGRFANGLYEGAVASVGATSVDTTAVHPEARQAEESTSGWVWAMVAAVCVVVVAVVGGVLAIATGKNRKKEA